MTFAVQVIAHCVGMAMLLLTEQETHVPAGAGRASRGEISLDLPPDYRGLRRG